MQQARGLNTSRSSSCLSRQQAHHVVHRAGRRRQRVTPARAASSAQVAVVGVGGVASQLVSQLWDSDACSHLDFLILNTDVQELTDIFMPDSAKLLLGARATKWAGTRGSKALGQAAAEESSDDIAAALQGADVVFVLAGTAGGTGGGAAPVVADLARQQGAITISVAMQPEQQQCQPPAAKVALATSAPHCQLSVCSQQQQRVGSMAVEDDNAALCMLSCCVQGVSALLQGSSEPQLSVEELQAAVSGRSSALGFAVLRAQQGPTAPSVTRALCAALSTPQCAPIRQHASAVLCFVAGVSRDALEEQAPAITDVLSSQCSSAAAVHMRPVHLDAADLLPPGAIAVTVLLSSPQALGGGGGGVAASTAQHVGDVAEVGDDDEPGDDGDEEGV